MPGRNVETVPLAPSQFHFSGPAFADLGDSSAAHHVVDRIASVTMGSRLLSGTELLDPATHRRGCRTTVLRIAIIHNDAIEWINDFRRRQLVLLATAPWFFMTYRSQAYRGRAGGIL
jgi:hypothetical protein